ncbi:MAG: Mov34/MPN/PAD-1 family protein [Planctomycetes bacterium]|nr:Mov34/MPN/PAD-1 family protein [Planctomycetota bacterium]
MITVPPAIITQMQDHAVAWYPGECCGLLFARAGSDEAVRAVCMDNLADKLHARDPEGFPQTAREYFSLNERQAARHVEEATARGERWLAIFHSHIDCGAYFSTEDQAMAAPGGVPVDPSLWHVVMEVWADGIRIARAFKWDGSAYAGVVLPGFERPSPRREER